MKAKKEKPPSARERLVARSTSKRVEHSARIEAVQLLFEFMDHRKRGEKAA